MTYKQQNLPIFKYTVELCYFWCYFHQNDNIEHFYQLKKFTHVPFVITPLPPTPCQPMTCYYCSYVVFRISYKRNHTICAHFLSSFFHSANYFEIQPCCYMYKYFILLFFFNCLVESTVWIYQVLFVNYQLM